MYLIFDTETTGVPRLYDAPVSDIKNWPRVVQIAWRNFDVHGRKKVSTSYIIRPDGFTIPKEAERIHGISTSRASRVGVPIDEVLDEFAEALSESSVVVAHNLQFDLNITSAEFYRVGVPLTHTFDDSSLLFDRSPPSRFSLGCLNKDGLLGCVHLFLVDTYRCAHIGQHPYLLSLRPDGFHHSLTKEPSELSMDFILHSGYLRVEMFNLDLPAKTVGPAEAQLL